MKTKIMLLLFGITILNVNAQLKHFLPNSNAVISILDHKYWFEGDTVINDIRYTRVYRQKCQSEASCGELSYYAAIREDTTGGKIHAVFPCSLDIPYLCDEVLLADFNVQAGDRIEVYSNWPGLAKRLVTVDDVDSIWIDNQYRKRINIVNEYGFNSYEWPSDSWVEGIGSIAFGLFFPSPERIMDIGDTPKFLCMHLDGKLLYMNPFCNTCFLTDGGTSIPPTGSPEDKKYYFVTDNRLYIRGNFTYRIYNVCGSLILPGCGSSSTVNISRWTTGIYFIQLYKDKELVYSGKFVKC